MQNTLGQIEDTFRMRGRYYNAVVRDFHTMIEQFPSNIVRRHGTFKEREFSSERPVRSRSPNDQLSHHRA